MGPIIVITNYQLRNYQLRFSALSQVFFLFSPRSLVTARLDPHLPAAVPLPAWTRIQGSQEWALGLHQLWGVSDCCFLLSSNLLAVPGTAAQPSAG